MLLSVPTYAAFVWLSLWAACNIHIARSIQITKSFNISTLSRKEKEKSVVGYVVKLDNDRFAFSSSESEGTFLILCALNDDRVQCTDFLQILVSANRLLKSSR